LKDDSRRTGTSEIDRLLNALKRGADESPEKRAYLQQKTKLLQVEEKQKKRKSNMELARELRLESIAIDSDNEDDNVLKHRMKSASRRIFARILEEVEGETVEAALPTAPLP
jgi:ActR/RegA family two-component response regulator